MQYPNVEVLYFASLRERLLYGDVQQHDTVTPEQIDWLFGKDVLEEAKTYERNGILFIGERGHSRQSRRRLRQAGRGTDRQSAALRCLVVGSG